MNITFRNFFIAYCVLVPLAVVAAWAAIAVEFARCNPPQAEDAPEAPTVYDRPCAEWQARILCRTFGASEIKDIPEGWEPFSVHGQEIAIRRCIKAAPTQEASTD